MLNLQKEHLFLYTSSNILSQMTGLSYVRNGQPGQTDSHDNRQYGHKMISCSSKQYPLLKL